MSIETPGKIVTIPVEQIVSQHTRQLDRTGWNYEYYYKINLKDLDTNNTYIVIFGAYQDAQLKSFLEHVEEKKDVNIVYKAPKAVNRRGGHGTKPRNTLVIFDYVPVNESVNNEAVDGPIPAV